MKLYTPSRKEKQQDQLLKDLEAGQKDMQAFITRGYKSLKAATFLLISIDEGKPAKDYFNWLVEYHITRADKDSGWLPKKGDPTQAVHIAFTSSGLRKLHLPEAVIDTFSRVFIEGMCHTYTDPDNAMRTINERSALLGDTQRNDPANWRWGNEEAPVDCAILLYAAGNNELEKLKRTIFYTEKKGVTLVYEAATHAADMKFPIEHFGFQDGISQPIMRGFSKAGNIKGEANLVNPGEFILGYLNEYNNYSPSPSVDKDEASQSLPLLPGCTDRKDLGKNGTYLVFRQMEQHVERFWNFLYQHSKETGVSQTDKAIKLGAKMVGRWPEGQPLATCPSGDCPMDDNTLNDFKYAAADKDGVGCPFGAHIRRMNPRDQVHNGRGTKDSTELSKMHRMLRRGRIYGEPLDKAFDINNMICQVKDKLFDVNTPNAIDCNEPNSEAIESTKIKRGIHFICLVSDIGRQFEFVQNVWANTSTFGDLCNEVDPMISPRPTDGQPHCHEFTTPQEIVRNRYKNVPEFTTVVGGAYFFLPGINALKYILK